MTVSRVTVQCAGRSAIVCVLLAAATAFVYAPVLTHVFVGFDDPMHVTGNAHVRAGFTPRSLSWAWQTTYTGHWLPLTWMSHMLDVELFGLDPGGHHLSSVLLHVLNALLLFAVLKRATTGATWPAAWAAGLFALHPLHVESVAWVAERKDVLCTALGLLSIAAYASYARGRGAAWYLLSLLVLALGLAAKPMLVTLPFVLLLLDYWPLSRKKVAVPFLLLEKVPFLALALLCSAAAYEAEAVSADVPLRLRAANAAVSYVGYIGQTIWPNDLAIFYPHPYLPGGRPPGAAVVAGSVILLVALSALFLLLVRRRYAAVGWLWYLGMLVPVIGLVQIGEQAMADRYTYLPMVGLLIVAAWGGRDLISRLTVKWPHVQRAAPVGALALLLVCAATSRLQLGHWRDSVALYGQAVRVAPNNPTMLTNLGFALYKTGRGDEAVRCYLESLKLRPDAFLTHNNLAVALRSLGRLDEAIEHGRHAVAADPEEAVGHFNLAGSLHDRGSRGQRDPARRDQARRDMHEAVRHYRRALQLNPMLRGVHLALGRALSAVGDFEAAAESYQRALESNPASADAHEGLAQALAAQNLFEQALVHFDRLVELQPRRPLAHYNLALCLSRLERLDEAAAHYRIELQHQPRDAATRIGLADILAANGETAEAIRHYEAALAAVPLDPVVHFSLAAACEAAERRDQAIEAARTALDLAVRSGRSELADRIRSRFAVELRTKPDNGP